MRSGNRLLGLLAAGLILISAADCAYRSQQQGDRTTARDKTKKGAAIGAAAGAVLGAFVPQNLSLDFAIPLVFIALLVPALRDRSDGVAASTAAVTAVIAAGVPYNLGLITAPFIGIAAGVWHARRKPA